MQMDDGKKVAARTSYLLRIRVPFQGGTSFVDLLCFFCLVFAMPLCASVYMFHVVTCWERADLLTLVCGVYLLVCHFLIDILGQVWYLIVSIPDLCTLTYFYWVHKLSPKKIIRNGGILNTL